MQSFISKLHGHLKTLICEAAWRGHPHKIFNYFSTFFFQISHFCTFYVTFSRRGGGTCPRYPLLNPCLGSHKKSQKYIKLSLLQLRALCNLATVQGLRETQIFVHASAPQPYEPTPQRSLEYFLICLYQIKFNSLKFLQSSNTYFWKRNI